MGRSRGGRGEGPRAPAPAPLPTGVRTTSSGRAELVPDRADPARWTLFVNGVPSSPVHLEDPRVLEFEYLQWMADVLELLAAPAPPQPLRALHLGGGACALARHVEAVRPDSRQVVVEVDEELARLVREVVPLPRAPLVRIQVGDARARLATRHDGGADAVVRDAFAGDTTPRHLTTREFVADAARVLAPGGLYLANVVDRTGAAAGASLASEVATALDVFAHVLLVVEPAVLRGRRYGNAVLVGCTGAPARDALTALDRRLRGGAAPARLLVDDELAALAARGGVLADAPPTGDAPSAGGPAPDGHGAGAGGPDGGSGTGST